MYIIIPRPVCDGITQGGPITTPSVPATRLPQACPALISPHTPCQKLEARSYHQHTHIRCETRARHIYIIYMPSVIDEKIEGRESTEVRTHTVCSELAQRNEEGRKTLFQSPRYAILHIGETSNVNTSCLNKCVVLILARGSISGLIKIQASGRVPFSLQQRTRYVPGR